MLKYLFSAVKVNVWYSRRLIWGSLQCYHTLCYQILSAVPARAFRCTGTPHLTLPNLTSPNPILCVSLLFLLILQGHSTTSTCHNPHLTNACVCLAVLNSHTNIHVMSLWRWYAHGRGYFFFHLLSVRFIAGTVVTTQEAKVKYF